MKTNDIIQLFKKMNINDQKDLLKILNDQIFSSNPFLSNRCSPEKCPKCGHHKIHKHGKYKNGGMRYKCVKCNKTFNELSGTSIHNIKKKYLLERFLELSMQDKSIRNISKILKISTKTAFNWRHKILTGLMGDVSKNEYKGLIEVDALYFRLNQKGLNSNSENFIQKKNKRGISNDQVCIMGLTDRYSTLQFKTLKIGKLDMNSMNIKLDSKRFNASNIICSDSEKSIINYFKKIDIPHKTFIANKGFHGLDKTFHVNTLNNAIGRLKMWLKFNYSSVSTKYLDNYLNFFMIKESFKTKKWLCNQIMKSDLSYKMNMGINQRYLELINF